MMNHSEYCWIVMNAHEEEWTKFKTLKSVQLNSVSDLPCSPLFTVVHCCSVLFSVVHHVSDHLSYSNSIEK